MVIRTPYGNRFGSVFGSRFFNAHETSSTPLVLDPDAETYIAAVEAADGQELELAVKVAYNNFILGCKSDGIWTAIKSSCILAGARTLDGALVPLVGTAPTSNNFVSGDYTRTTGLLGDGSTKYLDSNRPNNSDPQNNKHISAYLTVGMGANSQSIFGTNSVSTNGVTWIYGDASNVLRFYNNSRFAPSPIFSGAGNSTGFIGSSRSTSASFTARVNGSDTTVTQTSQTPSSNDVLLFAYNNIAPDRFATCRIAFYSIGTSLNLSSLDSRVTQLVTDIGNAIS